MGLPKNFNKWDKATQDAVREVLAARPETVLHGHGYELYFLVPNPDNPDGKDTRKPISVSLGFETTVPRYWTWEGAEPFMWRQAADFIRADKDIKR